MDTLNAHFPPLCLIMCYIIWKKQDHLILHAILASLTETIIPLVSSATSSHEAWSRLSHMYAKRTNSYVIHFKDKLSLITRGTKSVVDFHLSIKTIDDELGVIGSPPSNKDLLLYYTCGLRLAYKEIIDALCAQDILSLPLKNSMTSSLITRNSCATQSHNPTLHLLRSIIYPQLSKAKSIHHQFLLPKL